MKESVQKNTAVRKLIPTRCQEALDIQAFDSMSKLCWSHVVFWVALASPLFSLLFLELSIQMALIHLSLLYLHPVAPFLDQLGSEDC